MTPQFAKAVDPVFLGVLGLVERLEKGEQPNPEEERAAIRKALDDVEMAGISQTREWELSRYALVAWIDEVLIDSGGHIADRFREKPLEFELYESSKREVEFFLKAKEARELSGRDALEVFYLCVVLGFRGLYRKPSSAEEASPLGLPPDLETWSRHTTQAIHYGQNRAPLVDNPQVALHAPPQASRFLLAFSVLALGALILLLSVVMLS